MLTSVFVQGMASDQPLKPPKNLINKVLKLSRLLLSKYRDIDNFLVSRYIAKTVVSLSPNIRVTIQVC